MEKSKSLKGDSLDAKFKLKYANLMKKSGFY
jgi:tetratricopeptide (TPR) repeat protein